MQTPDSPAPISLRAYAKLRGVSAMAVSNAVKYGRLVKCVVRDARDQPKISDPALADQEWEANTDAMRRANALGGVDAPKPAPPVHTTLSPAGRGLLDSASESTVDNPPEIETDPETGGETVGSSTQRLKSAQADLAELKYAQAAGELVSADVVERRLINVFSSCKSALLAIPSRARQQLPHLTNADVLELEGLIREALENLAEAKPVDADEHDADDEADA